MKKKHCSKTAVLFCKEEVLVYSIAIHKKSYSTYYKNATFLKHFCDVIYYHSERNHPLLYNNIFVTYVAFKCKQQVDKILFFAISIQSHNQIAKSTTKCPQKRNNSMHCIYVHSHAMMFLYRFLGLFSFFKATVAGCVRS